MEPSSALSSWSQAFEDHSVVQTRAIEKQLRADIAHNKQKLRNLVGGSYRDLLATAEQIVTLDAETTKVESQISELGRNCRPRQYISPQGRAADHSNLARISLLHRCSSCIVSCLKAGQVILAAKLLAISRLLHTSLSKQEHPPKILDTLWDQLSRSRRRLLRRIDRRLDDATIEQVELTAVISAFCLATSSSCNDAIHHFQHHRLGMIHRSAQGAHGDHQHTTKTFKYYIDSLRTTKLLLAHDVPQALRRLQQTAILQDPDVLKLEHLNLNSLRILMPNEIQTFTPYIKNSALSEHEAKTLLGRWSEGAFGIVRSQLISHLETLADTASAFRLRQDLLSAWLQYCFSTPAHSDIIDTLRSTLNECIESLVQAQISAIAAIATRIIQSSEDTHENPATKSSATNTTTPELWSPALVASPLTHGAHSFLAQLKCDHLGSTPSLQDVSASFSTWCSSIISLRTSIISLTKIRWQDCIEEPEDADEDTAKAIIRRLSVDDPNLYESNLNDSLEASIASFQDRLASAVKASKDMNETLFLLRAVRDVALQLSSAFPETSLSQLDSSMPHLHSVLAHEVVTRLSAVMEAPRGKQIDVALLPDNLPSPTAFKTLRTLCRIMLEVGGIDTWTSAATNTLKEAGRSHILREENKGHYLRNDFDEIYLRTALGAATEGIEAETDVKKAAIEYWGRTRLLFGVLDP